MGLSLVERLRQNGNAGVDGDTAFEAAAEIERCLVAFENLENEARKLKAQKERGERAITELQAVIAERDAEIVRLKADTAAILQAAARGFRQGYHAAASQFSGIVYELARMTVPIGQQHRTTTTIARKRHIAVKPNVRRPPRTARAEAGRSGTRARPRRVRRRPGAGHAVRASGRPIWPRRPASPMAMKAWAASVGERHGGP
jgi:uncharacterized protein with PIN domain